MLNVELDRASERRLVEEARKRGLTAEGYATLLLQTAINSPADETVPRVETPVEDWERELDELIEDQDRSTPPIPAEALRRENLYEDRS